MSSDLEIITAVFPQVNESNKEGAPRTPFSGTIDDIGSDLGKIKEIGVNHVILGPTDRDLDRVINSAKQLSKFTR